MIVLFINAHKNDHEGQNKFERYYSYIQNILRETIYYGNHFSSLIRNKDQLADFLYDPFDSTREDRAKQKFKSVTYVFIDGSLNLPPWSPSNKNLFLFIRNCLKDNVKVHFNGFGHIAAYYQLSTGFNKDYVIGRSKNPQLLSGKEDYLYQEQTGDLYFHDKKICNSGIIVNRSNRPFSSKSSQALKKGVVLPTKFHYLAFDAKNGHKLLQNIKFPFPIYEKSKVFCTPKTTSKAKVNVLIETEGKTPLAFTYENCLSTHLICAEMLKLFVNWIKETSEIKITRQITNEFNDFDEIGFDNHLQQQKTISYLHTVSKANTRATSPKIGTSKKKFQFEKPSLRCSGPYFSQYDRSLMEANVGKQKRLGRSRFIFKGEMQKNEIKNYVQRTPSRPPSAHNFRDVNKSKWIDKKTFFVT